MKSSESIYRQFIEFEERAASIYLTIASHFSSDPELSAFWVDMALHEKQHAGLLQFCMCDRMFVPDPPDSGEIRKLSEFFDRAEKSAADPGLTVPAAFELAIELESSEVNSIYSHLTAVLHGSMYLLRRKIATSLNGHIDQLLKAAQRFGIPESDLRQLEGVRERFPDQFQTIEDE